MVGLRKTVLYFEQELQRATHDQRNFYRPEERAVSTLQDFN